jgi:hypothetical protein
MEANQVHVVAAAVFCDSQQIIHALETRFTGQIVSDVGDGDRLDRVHDDVALVHLVAATHLDMRTRPDANAAPDSAAPDSVAKAFGEDHYCRSHTQTLCCYRLFRLPVDGSEGATVDPFLSARPGNQLPSCIRLSSMYHASSYLWMTLVAFSR